MEYTKVPMRKCIGCNISKPKTQLIRLASDSEEIKMDLKGKLHGRGSYICMDKECLKKAIKRKAFNRAFGKNLSDEAETMLLEELNKYEKDK